MQKDIQSGFTPDNILYTPDNIVSFIARMAAPWKPERVLDPGCGSASFFPAIDSHLENKARYIGVDIGPEIVDMAKEKLKGSGVNFRLFNQDFFDFKETLEEKFDLVVSQPSIVQLQEVKEVKGFKALDMEIACLLSSMNLLKDGGHLVFVLPEQKSYFYSDYYLDFRKYLIENYSLEAVISLPYSTVYPYSIIKTCIVVFKKDSQRQDVFFAKYNKHEEDFILENFQEHQSNENLSQGFWVDAQSLKEDNVYWIYDYLRGLKESQKKKEESPYPLKSLSNIVQFKKGFGHSDMLLLFPKLPQEDVIFYSELENEAETSNYYPALIRDKNVSAPFLKIYLNSQMAKNERSLLSYGSLDKNLDRKAFQSLFIEVPDLEIQNKIVETCQRADKLYHEIDSVYNNFREHIFNYGELNEILDKYSPPGYPHQIWPLATSHHMLSKVGANPQTRLDVLFKLSEMIAAFNSIVLLSALPEELYHQEKGKIWGEEGHYHRMSLGVWLNLYETLAGIYGKMDRETCRVLPLGKKFYDKIASPLIINSIKPVVKKRNEIAHGGTLSDVFAEKTYFEMNKYLTDIFKSLQIYEKLRLIYPTGLEKSGGLYTIKAKILKGNVYPFEEKEFETESDLDTKTLYLYDPVTQDRLRLIPELVKLVECEDCGNWSLYFYGRIEEDYVRYISYQYEAHDFQDRTKAVEKFFSS